MGLAGSEWTGYERVNLVRTAFRATVTAAVVLVVYFTIPVIHHPHQAVALRLGVALALFVTVLLFEVRAITQHQQPQLRAAVSMATVIPLFIVLFAWIYLTMSRSDPTSFGGALSRVSSLYFTVSVFSTVGFGDITPKSDVARLVTTVQMMADLVVIALIVRLLLAAASRSAARLSRPDRDE